MSPFAKKTENACAKSVVVTDSSLKVKLCDGRTISAPISWFPRLLNGNPQERNSWMLIGKGEGIHWPDLDEDISVAGLLNGTRSGESRRSFRKWLERRRSG